MKTVMIVFETKYGQTQKIAERIGEIARERGFDARVAHVSAVELSVLDKADAFFVLAPVYSSRHPRSIAEFVRVHGGTLARRPGAFVSVSGGAASASEAERAAVRKIAAELLESNGWRPRMVVTAGGAIAFPKYGFIVRFFMKRIAKKHGGSTDTSRTHELTDWAEIERAATDLLELTRSAPEATRAPLSAG